MADWFYAKQGRQYGPVPEDRLRELTAAGEIQKDDFVWTEGMADWARAASLPNLWLHFGSRDAMQQSPPGWQGAAPTAGAEYAGFWLRFVAYIIDSLVVGAFGCVIGFAFGIFSAATGAPIVEQGELTAQANVGTNILSFMISWIYYAVFESSPWQATLGKKALGIQVVDLQGRRISFVRATGRHFAKILSALILLIGFIMAGFTERKQALHDIIASCLVIRRR